MTIIMVEEILVQYMKTNSFKTKLCIVTTVCTSEGIENPPRIEYAIQIKCSAWTIYTTDTYIHANYSMI